MILRIAYEDNAGKGHVPTPEHVEDTLMRMERTLNRMWAGKTAETVELIDMDEHTD